MRRQEERLTAALAHCAQVTRAHSSTFFLGSRLLPPRQRQAVMVVYAACREGDDSVDECSTYEDGRQRLAAWWKQIERSYAGKADRTDPLELALDWVLHHHDVPLSAFQELHLGLEGDLEGQSITTWDQLMLYCQRVAGVVGWMVAPICGFGGGEKTLQQALELGQAMQLTNILRDVGEDLEMGRCYLPASLLAKHQVELADLRAGKRNENYVVLLRELSSAARKLYRSGWQGIPKLHGSAKLAVGLAALNYEAILDRLEANDYDNLSQRAYLSPTQRLSLIPQTFIKVYGQRRLQAGS